MNDPQEGGIGIAEDQVLDDGATRNADDDYYEFEYDGDDFLGDGGDGGDDGGGNDGGDDNNDGGDDNDYTDNEVRIKINGDEIVSFDSIDVAAWMEYTEPEPKYVRQAEIIKARPGIYCVFWAPETEGDGESFISPVLHLPKALNERTPTYMQKAALSQFQLPPEVPAIPSHAVLHFHMHREDRRVIVLIETYDGDLTDAVLLRVDLDRIKQREGVPGGQRWGGIDLDGSEGRFTIYGYNKYPNIRRARVLVAPFLHRTVCIIGKRDNLAHIVLTSEGQKPKGHIAGAQSLVCKENLEEEMEA